MTWQAIVLRGREALTSLRARVSFRLIARVALAVAAIGSLAIALEAIVRARLGPPEARIPTAFYTRPVPWSRDQERRPAVAIGTTDGAEMEQRIPVRLRGVPAHLTQAVLAIEDAHGRIDDALTGAAG